MPLAILCSDSLSDPYLMWDSFPQVAIKSLEMGAIPAGVMVLGRSGARRDAQSICGACVHAGGALFLAPYSTHVIDAAVLQTYYSMLTILSPSPPPKVLAHALQHLAAGIMICAIAMELVMLLDGCAGWV